MRRRECAEGDHACTYQLTSAEANKAASKSHANLGCQVDAGGAESSLFAQMRSCHRKRRARRENACERKLEPRSLLQCQKSEFGLN
jgi:hypothetical protein